TQPPRRWLPGCARSGRRSSSTAQLRQPGRCPAHRDGLSSLVLDAAWQMVRAGTGTDRGLWRRVTNDRRGSTHGRTTKLHRLWAWGVRPQPALNLAQMSSSVAAGLREACRPVVDRPTGDTTVAMKLAPHDLPPFRPRFPWLTGDLQ